MTFLTYTTHGEIEVIPATEYRTLEAELARAKRRYAFARNLLMAVLAPLAVSLFIACGRAK